MSNELGERLVKLQIGDHLIIATDGERYKGKIAQADRQKCELNQGFMESGHLALYLDLNATSDERSEIPTNQILISVEEPAPQSWDQPIASIFDPSKGETISRLGEVTAIQTDEII